MKGRGKHLRLLFLAACTSLALFGCGGLSLDSDARFARALQAQEAGDFAAMVVDLKTILQQNPEHLEARLMLGEALQRTGDIAGSEKEFARAATIAEQEAATEPDAAQIEQLHRARLGLAVSQVALRKFAEARGTTAAILEAQPDAMLAHMLAIQAAFATNENEEARTHLDYVLGVRPNEPLANLFLGMVNIRQGRNEEGARYLEKTLSLRPSDDAVRLMLVRVQLILGEPVSAITTIVPILERGANDPLVIQLFESIDLRAEAVTAQVLTLADELATATPASFVPDLIRARVYFLQGNYDSALQHFSKAADLDGGRYAVLGGFLANRGLGETGAAERLLNDWLAVNPDDAVVRNILASSHLSTGDRAEAAEQYEQLLEAGKGNATALNNLAWIYGEMGDERAVGLARAAHGLEPRNGAITDTLGWLLVQNGSLAEGIQLLRQAVNQAPQSVEVRQHLATALSADGQEQEASRVLAELIGAGTSIDVPQTLQ